MISAKAERWFGENPSAVYSSSPPPVLVLYFDRAPRETECCPRRRSHTGHFGRWMIQVCERHRKELGL